MERRTALKVIAGSALAQQFGLSQHHLVKIAQDPSPYKLQFFSPVQNALVDRLSELIIPADDHSPGAHEAKVSFFIDLMVSNNKQEVQEQWLTGLKAVEAEAHSRFGKPFLECDARQQDEIMAKMAVHEVVSDSEDDSARTVPRSELERFFAQLKQMTIEGYYTSAIGIHQELQYKGNEVLAEFIGCTHPEHQH